MNRKRTIMLVDDSIANLTSGRNALIELYDVITVPSGEKMFALLGKIKPDLILLDVEMPGIGGYDIIRELKGSPKTWDIPVIFLSAHTDMGSELQGLSLGAIDYIAKPFSPPLLRKRIEVHLLVEAQRATLKEYNENLQSMVEEQMTYVRELQNAILQTVAELVEWRDEITGTHIERTRRFLLALAKEMARRGLYSGEMKNWNLEQLAQSAQLHDVGKITIPDSILKKTGKLSFEEFEIMKTHTTFGENVIEKIAKNTRKQSFLRHARIFAGTHHEKWDGSGYPKKLSEEAIPLQGRMMAIADVYDALISERTYKKAFSHNEAVEIIKESSGSHFDPSLIEVFMDISQDFDQIAKETEQDMPEE